MIVNLIISVAVVVVVMLLTAWIVRQTSIDARISNIILVVVGVLMLIWFLSRMGVVLP